MKNEMKNANMRPNITRYYSQFKLLTGNRVIDERHVIRLMKSIQEFGYIGAPILVNKKMEVIDGQHRLEACRRLDRPVPYHVVDSANLDSVIALNASQRNWRITDYINSYAARCIESYILMRRFIKESGYTLDISAFLLLGASGTNKSPTIKTGDLKCTHEMYDRAVRMAGFLHQFDAIKTNRRASFIRGIVYALQLQEVKEDHLTKKIFANPRAFEQIADMFDCIKVLERIYNKGRRSEYVYIETELRKLLAKSNNGRIVLDSRDKTPSHLFSETDGYRA